MAEDPTDLEEKLEEAAQGPARVRVDGTDVEARSSEDLIKADKYLAQKRSMRAGIRGFRLGKFIFPGNV